MLRVRYEKEGVAKAEELEMAKLKMQARLSEADSTAEQLRAKLAQLEKAKAKLAAELEAQAQALDQAQILNSAMEKFFWYYYDVQARCVADQPTKDVVFSVII